MQKVETILEFIALIEEWNLKEMFRGHLNSDWLLIPSIARYANYFDLGYYDSLFELEEFLILEFEKYVHPIMDFRRLPMIEKLIHCQHYGLPTRLLDWTTNPLKALYFAVENPEYDEKDGQIISFSPRTWYEGTKYIKEIKNIEAFYPELLNERISAQEGCFTVFPLPEDSMNLKPLEKDNYKNVGELNKVLIPSDSKLELRIELNKLGINHRTIYPGIEGVAKWVKTHLSDYRV